MARSWVSNPTVMSTHRQRRGKRWIWVRTSPNWTPWCLLLGPTRLFDGLLATLTFGFVDVGFSLYVIEKHLRMTVEKRR